MDFQSMIEEVRIHVQEEINNKDTRPGYMSEKQLCFILDELDKMERIRNIHLFYPYYPKEYRTVGTIQIHSQLNYWIY